jgi:hypothetical protein
MPPLKRKKVNEDTQTEESRIRLQSAAFTLKRSGRIIRRVNAGKHMKNYFQNKMKLDFSICLALNFSLNFKHFCIYTRNKLI